MSDEKVIRTHIPKEWGEEAEAMDLTYVEYVRRMARAGRKQWGFDHTTEPEQPHVQLQEPEPHMTADVETMLRDVLVRNLSTADGIKEDELVDIITGDLEEATQEILEELKRKNEVDYIPSKGGWVKEL